jgi:hypothetical protein
LTRKRDRRTFARFRCLTVTRFADRASELALGLEKTVSLDLVSPSLARLVGQEYAAISQAAGWVKPMSYRYANGPAGLRHEVLRLMRGMADLLGLPLGWLEAWANSASRPGRLTCAEIGRDGAPQAPVDETHRAVELAGDTPVCLGVEAVSSPPTDLHHAGVRPPGARASRETALPGRCSRGICSICRSRTDCGLGWDSLRAARCIPGSNECGSLCSL